MSALIPVRVESVDQISSVIKQFSFVGDGQSLPEFSAGSHVVVHMPGEDKTYRNAYSLIGDPADTSRYRIAVRLQPRSRGGSQYMHGEVREGDRLLLAPPANLFLPSWKARHHVLVAGGIGITPFLSYLHEFERRGDSYEVHYTFRNASTGGYCSALTDRLGDKLCCYRGERPDIRRLLERQPLGTHVYVCGPESMIESVRLAASALGWSPQRVHFEAFAAPQPGKPFAAKLARSGLEVDVDAETPLLDALEAQGVDVPNLCRGGVCGQCKTTVVEGEIEHRDAFLDDAEKASQRCIMPCVSRAASDTLILDI